MTSNVPLTFSPSSLTICTAPFLAAGWSAGTKGPESTTTSGLNLPTTARRSAMGSKSKFWLVVNGPAAAKTDRGCPSCPSPECWSLSSCKKRRVRKKIGRRYSLATPRLLFSPHLPSLSLDHRLANSLADLRSDHLPPTRVLPLNPNDLSREDAESLEFVAVHEDPLSPRLVPARVFERKRKKNTVDELKIHITSKNAYA